MFRPNRKKGRTGWRGPPAPAVDDNTANVLGSEPRQLTIARWVLHWKGARRADFLVALRCAREERETASEVSCSNFQDLFEPPACAGGL